MGFGFIVFAVFMLSVSTLLMCTGYGDPAKRLRQREGHIYTLSPGTGRMQTV
jgi:hypothetical protein